MILSYTKRGLSCSQGVLHWGRRQSYILRRYCHRSLWDRWVLCISIQEGYGITDQKSLFWRSSELQFGGTDNLGIQARVFFDACATQPTHLWDFQIPDKSRTSVITIFYRDGNCSRFKLHVWIGIPKQCFQPCSTMSMFEVCRYHRAVTIQLTNESTK